MSSPFRFKQFTVRHDRCQMKVGTDGVLLGALADPAGAATVLDVGTGCGLIALMMAQKSAAMITGIDLDEPSILQATENARLSPWPTRITMIHGTVQEFATQHPCSFDMIVSNPPFFTRSLKSPDPGTNRAKHDVTLTFQELVNAAYLLLKAEGSGWFILPVEGRDEFLKRSAEYGFHLAGQTIVYPRQGKPAHRCILQLKKVASEVVTMQELVIRKADNGLTEDYQRACSAFYLD